jgi:CheY-like chemotaxis protein
MLARLGHTADLAVDGEQAWTMLQSRTYDVLLTDVEMPVLDGVALAQRIRGREKTTGGHLPILGATAHVSEAERHRLLEAGMDEHVPKPFTLADLEAAFSRTLRGLEARAKG